MMRISLFLVMLFVAALGARAATLDVIEEHTHGLWRSVLYKNVESERFFALSSLNRRELSCE